ncbi:MAG: hypothetical protein LUG90_10770 [Clostridiaceae bacterium]|nr:hypothetical protein [Clostridiaceae bacterium]
MLHQNVVIDIGKQVTFEGFSLQQEYAKIIGMAPIF